MAAERLTDSRSPQPPEARKRGTCVITGASGYVGSRMARHLLSAGWDLTALTRSPPDGRADERITYVPFDLAGADAGAALEHADALVHVAYDFSHRRWSDIARVNIEGSRRLFATARAAEVQCIVCVSTVAAFPGARSRYGRAKLEIERVALDVGGAVIRPGLVWGPDGAAMFGALRAAVERLPVVPLPVPADLRVTTVHEDDLALFLERLLERWPEGSGELFVAACERMLTFGELLDALASKYAPGRRFLAVPWRAAWLALRALELLGIAPPFPSDRLLSLINTDSDPLARASTTSARYGVDFRPFSLP
jgi:nucleoside-diphosphate-sugar epimerase